MRSDLPTGTVTFLFTDVEGSTRLLHELGAEGYAAALAEHRRVIRDACVREGGVEVDTQGDAFFLAFPSAQGAISAAARLTEVLASGPIQVRVGVHTGTPLLTEEGYVGEDVHSAARVASAAHGGQIVVSASSAVLIEPSGSEPRALPLIALGEHRLKDIAETVSLYQLGEGSFPPLKTISNTNLPRPASSFLGREDELQEVLARIAQGARLLTLTGPGGTGKTRLALEAATTLVGSFKAGVFWVGLATLRDPALVTETIAQTLGAKEGLAEHIGERELLLLLDNLEHVIEAAPELSALLERCPNLTLLVTSRELLRVQGEVEYPVPPLAAPEAVDLFCTRAQLSPSLEISELCARVDSLPLAVELAAARTKVLSVDQILERLAGRLDMLKGGRDADPRQATLRATIEWSYDLLSEKEQQLFVRLSVFAGGCTLEAAEAVCGADLDTLQSLVEKSLLRFTPSDSSPRYWMLETIREYASERLEASEEKGKMARRHASYLLAVAESSNLAVERFGAGEQRWDLVIPEQGNIRAAVRWAIEADGELGLRLACALENYWVTNNPAEGARLFTTLLAAAGDIPDTLRARGLRCLGSSSYVRGDFDRGTTAYEESLTLYRMLGDVRGIGHMVMRLAFEANRVGDATKARSLAMESLAVSRRYGFATDEAQALHLLAELAFEEGRHGEAFELLDRSAELCEKAGFRWWEKNVLATMADYALRLDGAENARAPAKKALAIAHDIGDRQGVVYGLAINGWIAGAAGHVEHAGRLWGAIEAEEQRGGPVGQWEADRAYYEERARAGSDAEFETGRAEGRRLLRDEAVGLALASLD